MPSPDKPTELMAVLDYILNRCTIREIDALEAAVERRRRDLTSSTGIIALDPARAAHSMGETVRESINHSMDGIRKTFREFAVETIRREAPELTEEQMRELVEAWIPESMSVDSSGRVTSSSGTSDAYAARQGRSSGAGRDRYVGLSKKGLINGIPREAMREMIVQFVSYSGGTMTLSDEAALREAVGDWTGLYWKKFPSEVKSLVKDYLSGVLTVEEFETELSGILQ